jgi:PAS domain-containing protein
VAATFFSVPLGFSIGKPLGVFVAEKERRPFRMELNRLKGLQRLSDWELHLQTHEGTVFPRSVTVTTVRGADGQMVDLSCLIRDITERKQVRVSFIEVSSEDGLRGSGSYGINPDHL